MFTLLRHPDVLARLRHDPDNMVGPTVEEVLRYEPPVHHINRTSLADINIDGVTIPKRGDRNTLAGLRQPRSGLLF
jgi:cytochrome P450